MDRAIARAIPYVRRRAETLVTERSELQEQRRKARLMAYMLGAVAIAFFLAYITLGVLNS